MFCLSELKDTNRARRQQGWQAGSSDGRWRSTSLEALDCLSRLGLSSGDKVKSHGPQANLPPVGRKKYPIVAGIYPLGKAYWLSAMLRASSENIFPGSNA